MSEYKDIKNNTYKILQKSPEPRADKTEHNMQIAAEIYAVFKAK